MKESRIHDTRRRGRRDGAGPATRCALLTFLAASLIAPTPAAAEPSPLERPDALAAAAAGGVGALPELTAALAGPRPDLAVRAIGLLALPQAVPTLLPLTRHEDGELRAAAAWAIGRCDAAQGAAELVALATDPYGPAREAALLAVAGVARPDAEAAIRQALGDANPAPRLAAARAIGENGRADLFGLLLPLLQWHLELRPDAADRGATPRLVETVIWTEPDLAVRLAAIQSLGALRVPESLPALIRAMEREDSFNRLAILDVISAAGESAAGVCLGRIVPTPYDKDAFARHLPLLINNGALAVIAGKLGDERCVPALLDVLSLPRDGLGRDKNLTELYIDAATLLGHFRCERAARHLVALLQETEIQQLADACHDAIRSIGRAAARPLARHLDDWRTAPAFLALLREETLRTAAARDGIVKLLAHESDEVRLAAVETLGSYLAAGVLPEYDLAVLEAMYLDPNAEIRARCGHWTERARERIEGGKR